MTKLFVSIAALSLLAATPAFAMKGIDAARACDANPKCIAIYGETGGVTILVNDKTIDCAGPKAECTVLLTKKPQKPWAGPTPSLTSDSGSGESGGSGGQGGFDRDSVVGGNSGTFSTGSGGGGVIQ